MEKEDELAVAENNVDVISFEEFGFDLEFNNNTKSCIATPYDCDKYDYVIVIEGNIKNEDVTENNILFDEDSILLFNDYVLTKENYLSLKEKITI